MMPVWSLLKVGRVIEHLTQYKAEGEKENWDLSLGIKANTHFYRLAYFKNLAWIFGPVG